MLRKVVAIGPESTGKSTLCQRLAEHYGTRWCPEYARHYLTEHGMKYGYDDLLRIAKGQIMLEDEYARLAGQENPDQPPLLLVDTNMYVMKVWCEFVFGKCHSYILDQIRQRKYDLYLLCNTDLVWSPDQLREYPDLETRAELYAIYKNLLAAQDTPWVEITGNDAERVNTAITAIGDLVQR
jgi:NadR type nicotinamide-nucleotide adenylyltransferase